MICLNISEPEFDIVNGLQDGDALKNDDAEFECEMNDEDAEVTWYKEDEVRIRAKCKFTSLIAHLNLFHGTFFIPTQFNISPDLLPLHIKLKISIVHTIPFSYYLSEEICKVHVSIDSSTHYSAF